MHRHIHTHTHSHTCWSHLIQSAQHSSYCVQIMSQLHKICCRAYLLERNWLFWARKVSWPRSESFNALFSSVSSRFITLQKDHSRAISPESSRLLSFSWYLWIGEAHFCLWQLDNITIHRDYATFNGIYVFQPFWTYFRCLFYGNSTLFEREQSKEFSCFISYPILMKRPATFL